MSQKDKSILLKHSKELERIVNLYDKDNPLQITHFLMGLESLESLPRHAVNFIENNCQDLITEKTSCFSCQTFIKPEISITLKDLLRSNKFFLSKSLFPENKEKTKSKLNLLKEFFKLNNQLPKKYFIQKISS